VDVLRWPLVGPVLRWRHFRTTTQLVLVAVAILTVAHGLIGPELAPRNLATVLTWIHYRGLLIGVLLAAGNAFCGACPMILVRDIGRLLHRPARRWPSWLRSKWLALGLFVGVLFAYELFDLWAWPAATAWLIVGYFGVAFVIDNLFTGASFCKYVCPVGQFNFVASALSPLEIRARSREVCASCKTVDCIRGRRDALAPAVVIRRGCELDLFVPSKIGNLDCTFCLDCVQACPHENVALGLRVPGDELVDDNRRSSLGRLSRRPDLAALALVFTAGGLISAFAMVRPVYATEGWLGGVLGTTSEFIVLGTIFFAALCVGPVILCGSAAWATRRMAGASRLDVRDIAMRYAYTLVPLGVGMWLAHSGFHLLTGIWTAIPVAQNAAIDLTNRAFLGAPKWGLLGVRPGMVFPLQLGFVLLGAVGSTMLVHRVSERDHPGRAARAALPWMLMVIGLAAVAVWILAQPMEMRGTGMGG